MGFKKKMDTYDKTMRFRVGFAVLGVGFQLSLYKTFAKNFHRNSSEECWLTITAIKNFNGLQ